MLFSFIFLLTASFLWFYIPITSYFSQDDFFHLRLIMDKNITDIPSFFTQQLEGQTFYRPLSRETYNLTMYKLFGLNPIPFHIANLLLILVNVRLLFLFVNSLNSNSMLAIFTSIVYLLSSVHSIELYYLASVQTLMAATLVLLSCIFYVKFLREKILNYYLASVLFFLIALFCHESAIILVGLIFLTNFVIQGNTLKEKVLSIVPFIILAILYFVSIWDMSSLPKQQVYKVVFQPKSILNTFSWYVLWSFGLPEMLVDFVRPKFVLKEEFVIWYSYYAKIVFPLLFFVISLLLMMVWSLKKIIFTGNFLIFLITSFLISISPFLLFPQHKFVYYLSLPIIWFSATLGLILAVSWTVGNFYRVLTVSILLSFLIISYQTITLNSNTHWAAKRAKAAEALMEQFKADYPSVPKGSIFYITDDPNYPDIAREWGTSSKQAFYILSGSDALQLLYKDPSIKVYYQALDPPENLDLNNMVSLTARFPY